MIFSIGKLRRQQRETFETTLPGRVAKPQKLASGWKPCYVSHVGNDRTIVVYRKTR